MFFFEKKNQKTFSHFEPRQSDGAAQNRAEIAALVIRKRVATGKTA